MNQTDGKGLRSSLHKSNYQKFHPGVYSLAPRNIYHCDIPASTSLDRGQQENAKQSCSQIPFTPTRMATKSMRDSAAGEAVDDSEPAARAAGGDGRWRSPFGSSLAAPQTDKHQVTT